MSKLSVSVVAALACSSLLAACAGKVGGGGSASTKPPTVETKQDESATTESARIWLEVVKPEAKKEEAAKVEPAPVNGMAAVIANGLMAEADQMAQAQAIAAAAEKKISHAVISVKDPANDKKVVKLDESMIHAKSPAGFAKGDLSSEILLQTLNESKTWSINVRAICQEKRDNVCDLVIAYVQSTKADDTSKVDRQIIYFGRAAGQPADQTPLTVLYKYNEFKEVKTHKSEDFLKHGVDSLTKIRAAHPELIPVHQKTEKASAS